MRKLIFIPLLFAYSAIWGQQTDASITTQVDDNIRNASTAGSVTRAVVANAFESLNDSKVNRSETLVATGTNDYTITPGWTPDYSKNPQFKIKFVNGNTGAVTVNTIPVKKNVSTALSSGDIPAGAIFDVVYDGTNFQINLSTGGGGGSSTFTGLTDGPGSFSGKTLNFVRVNSGETALEYQTPSQVRTDIGAGTGNGTVTSVTVTQPAAGITVTNSGSAQTPTASSTIALANDLAAVEGLSSTGIAVRTTTDTWAQRTVTGTSNQITVTNGDGVSGNPTLSLPSSLVLPNGATATTQSANDNSAKVSTTSYADAKVEDAINDGTTAIAPSENAVKDALDLKLNTIATTNAQTGTSYTLVLSDANNIVELTNSGSINLTVPPNSSVAFDVGTRISIRRTSADPALVTFVQGSGVTVNTTLGALTDAGRNVEMILEKTGTNTWLLQNGKSVSLGSSDVTGALGYTPVPPTRTIAGVDLADNVTATELQTALDVWHKTSVSTADFTTTSTSYVDAVPTSGPTLTFPINANERTQFSAYVKIVTANTSEGYTISITGPSLTSCVYKLEAFSTGTNWVSHASTSYDESTALVASSVTTSYAELHGTVLTSASGNITLRIKTETGGVNVTVKAASWFEYRVVGTNN